ncbi:PREDICTED: uncharacterized protein LOC101302358 [Fragaria vesca subsp. vesca]|uniref:uncharacterized protein LOC101302358 n=1 Tax=Fragaria vesca subsp. vesca TaxID=101020 RepID=UPI0002C36AC7|nr:PREDICTED: uncharacterized protein LOC101302358 [Fragaria vesca subsp. vesca]
MASRPSPSSPPSSASNSDHSATQPTSLPPTNPHPQAEAVITNGVLNNVDEKKPASFDDLHTADHIKKFKKYEADYTRWLTAKYFSNKTLYGGNIFDGNMTIQDEVIKSSRWPCTRSYADPVQGFEDQTGSCSTSTTTAETSPNLSNGKHPVK